MEIKDIFATIIEEYNKQVLDVYRENGGLGYDVLDEFEDWLQDFYENVFVIND